MRCTSPRTVGFHSDGKTLCWSPSKASKEYASFQLPCGKCLSCRLQKARETAIRSMHEAQMHENNVFVTLTYSDENLKSDRLQYNDFQLFIKRLRDKIYRDYVTSYGKQNWQLLTKQERKEHYDKLKIGILGTGEYGDRTKRPHFHALIFNWRPSDTVFYRTTDTGDQIFTSADLDKLWGLNDPSQRPCEIGAITLQSAGYVARYATKKLRHGKDGDHNFEPICKRSSKNAIGKKWIEKFYQDVFNYGYLVLPDGTKASIPRYYDNWLKRHHPEKWIHYVTHTKQKIIEEVITKENKITQEERKANLLRASQGSYKRIIKKNKVRDTILKSKVKKLQENIKL